VVKKHKGTKTQSRKDIKIQKKALINEKADFAKIMIVF